MEEVKSVSFFEKLYSYLYFHTWNYGLWTPPDRRFLIEELFEVYAKDSSIQTVLFVGVRRYTSKYSEYFKHAHFLTIDTDPTQARFGATDHIVDDVCNLSHWHSQFPKGVDLAFMNGVVGFGLNNKENVERAIEALASAMSRNAKLVFGINPHMNTPLLLENSAMLKRHFRRATSPISGKARDEFTFPGLSRAKHEYRYYVKIPAHLL
jgi:hypothetical protein